MPKLIRFKSVNATPPGGVYEYSVNGRTVTSRSRIGISQQARALRKQEGLRAFSDGFIHVMDYMCRGLPDGFCTSPSGIKTISPYQVKQNTMTLFSMRLVPVDEIQRREQICIACPRHQRRGFCPSCTGLHTWVYAGFGGRRPELVYDTACGACPEDAYLVTASSSVAELPETPGANYPEGCWRIQKKEAVNGTKENQDGQ